nr:hypothetical protein [Deltaproteobacteria bacterium]
MSWSGQLHDRYGQALADNVVLIALAVAAAVAYVVITDRKREWTLPAWAPTAALSALCVFAIVWAWQLRWLSDDAWISVLLSLGSHVGVLIMTTRLVRKLEAKPVISLAAVVLACSYVTATYATGGLETFGAVLVLLSIAFAAGAADRRALLVSGLCGIAATMVHLDHAIFYVALGGVLLARRVPIKQLASYAAPVFVVFVPVFLMRWSYDGLPNTRSADFSRGGIYLYA